MSRVVRDSSQCSGRSNRHTEDLSEYNAIVMWFWIVFTVLQKQQKVTTSNLVKSYYLLAYIKS